MTAAASNASLLPLLTAPLLFFLVTYGLAWPVARRLALAPVERLGVSTLLSTVGVFLVAWGIYVFTLPWTLVWVLPVAAAAGFFLGREALREVWADRLARSLVVGHVILTAGCLGWLALIFSYGGGGWTGDWFEHWERAVFFLQRGPLDQKFIGYYALPARPPLANVVTAAFLGLTRVDFAVYQVISTLGSGLAFVPAALLVRRFGGGPRAFAVLVVLLLVSPPFLQNGTFTWTKLPTAFFTLFGLYFFLSAQAAPATSRLPALLVALSLAAAVSAHYSGAPYILLLGVAWLWLRVRHTALAFVVGAAFVACWLGWLLSTYGVAGTFLSNSSVTAAAPSVGGQAVRALANLRDSLIPHFIRPFDTSLITQGNAWGRWRDWLFQAYQLNVILSLGSVAWLGIAVALRRVWPAAPWRARAFWTFFCVGAVIVGVCAHGGRDTWGLAHICLLPLVVLGLAFLAAQWSSLSRGWRGVLVVGGIVDFLCGIALHFVLQSLGPSHIAGFGDGSRINYDAKTFHQLRFLGDVLPASPLLLGALIAAVLALALLRACREPAAIEA
ncbi:MAG: hypothetical protein V4773_21935 [Verrucomicrobiota bacterium]